MTSKRLLLINFNQEFMGLIKESTNSSLIIEGKFVSEGLIETHGAEFRVLNDPSFYTDRTIHILKTDSDYFLLEKEEEIGMVEESIKFYQQYDIPITFSSRRKFLTKRRYTVEGNKESAMDGTYHLFVEKAFVDGRVKRNANTFLCSTYTDLESNDKDKVFNNSSPITHPISCKRCLRLMERWKNE